MKLSRKFLNEYVNTKDITTQELADKMTLAGNEYDSVAPLSSATNLVVGYVQEIKDHPDSDHLHVCQVEIKPGEVVQIICGAPNVDKGQKIIVSLPGAILPGGIEIKKSVIRGEESNGMICSLGELGIESKYQTEEDRKGIHILDKDAPIGEDALKYLEFDDETIDFELTANRSDLLSVIGMAYEVGAILGEKVLIKEDSIKSELDDINNFVSLDVQTENCPVYLARMVKNVTIKESPQFIKARLMASGIRPINNVVDISNYVMIEYGQPLHFFDYKTLGNKIIVRMAKEDEKVTTLDEIERTLSKEDIVIANESSVVALAGVMGGLNSEVEIDTKDIVIESAIFNPLNVRYTSKKILKSEASSRFEKGLDAMRTYMAVNRACYLLEKYADGEVIKGTVTHDKKEQKRNIISITRDKIEKVLGLELTNDEIKGVFDRLGFDTVEIGNTFNVTVPSRRLDITILEDLIEEVGRIHGIGNIDGKLKIEEIKAGKYETNYLNQKLIRKRLESLGLNQVVTYSLTSLENVEKFTKEGYEKVMMQNPMSEDRKYMRHSILPSLLTVADYNLSRKNSDVLIYELSNVYYKKEEVFKEKAYVSGLMIGNYLTNLWNGEKIVVDFYLLKGIIENLLEYLGLNSRYSFDTQNLPKYFHSCVSARIIVDNKEIGHIGLINPAINKNKYYCFELDLDEINAIKVRGIKNKEISKYPAVIKDVAFVLDKTVLAGDVVNTIKKTCGRLLANIDIFDYYIGENIDSDKKSLAFSLMFMDYSKTLSDEEVMTLFNKVIEDVSKKHNGLLRDK